MYRKGSVIRQRASLLAHPELKPARPTVCYMGGVGTEIRILFSSIEIKICGSCQDKANEWDRKGIEWCRDNRPAIVEWLVDQAAKREVSMVAAAMSLCRVEPALAARIAFRQVRHPMTPVAEIAADEIVGFAIDRAIIKQKDRLTVSKEIPVVVVASPRERELHEKTFASVRAAGFTDIFASCEPGTDTGPMGNATTVVHDEKRGPWRNFIEAIKIGLQTNAPHFITLEDDVELCRGTSEFLTRAGWPSVDCGCLQLYAAQPLKNYPRGKRWRLSRDNSFDLLGACAMMFRRDAAETLVRWANEKGWRGDTRKGIDDPTKKKAADTFVGEVLTVSAYSIWIHNPSLANHIGEESTLGHNDPRNPNRRTLNFPGIDADLNAIFAGELNATHSAI